ncbi:PREDICTED: uncharacterized protein LOC107163484 [Diuraphis noxia]|uniref:uncharacterized protein LOC107163484 n=1 Tax=Diuraphis noxia TaxID=143948 RepID=UPI0007637007|nr:PREDICTED: uncharacterized protein LOC107163484 [Diuraphis noxia]XP_015366426.1 PREDICTED: uncharacterized protein LOC107163484 [Diuraphis noxia]
MVLKSFFQMFNPRVEAGPGRLVSRHRYNDGFMPDYPLEVIGHDGEWVKPPNDNDDGNVQTADYVDDGNDVSSGGGTSSGNSASSGDGAGRTSGDSSHRRMEYSIQQQKIDAAVCAAAVPSSGPGLRPDDHRPFSDFIASLLKTVQLTPRAILKKSKGKPTGAILAASKTAIH